jgi:hypothetical protein
MTYGDGGAGKTTLMVDLACHLAAGDDWLAWAVPRPLRVLLIENEGPRPFFRAKLRRKRDSWAGSDLGDRLHVLARPWGKFTYATKDWREQLAAVIREQEIDVVICGPLTTAGMEAAGTLQEVRAFLALVEDVRRRAGRKFASILVHHESKTGAVSGAWEGAGDTLLHVSGAGHGRLRLFVKKARWASEAHGVTHHLLWAPGETFTVEEREELDDEAIDEAIVAEVRANPGTGWTRVEEAIPGVRAERKRARRDALLAAGAIVNVRKIDGVETVVAEVPERTRASLYPADDPTLINLRSRTGRRPDADCVRPGGGGVCVICVLRPALKGDAGSRDADHAPL